LHMDAWAPAPLSSSSPITKFLAHHSIGAGLQP
jgi:hypothetical protein